MIQTFCEARDWDQFHGPKDLAIGVITEASELLEHFRFLSEDEALALLRDPKRKEQIEDEVADVLFFLLRFSQRSNISARPLPESLQRSRRSTPSRRAGGAIANTPSCRQISLTGLVHSGTACFEVASRKH